MRDIKIDYDAKLNCIEIIGNEKGLKFIADACLKVIGKDEPGNHFHLMEKMENLKPGSVDTTITFVPE